MPSAFGRSCYRRAQLTPTESNSTYFAQQFLSYHWPRTQTYAVIGSYFTPPTDAQKAQSHRYFKIDLAIEVSRETNDEIDQIPQVIVEIKPDDVSIAAGYVEQ